MHHRNHSMSRIRQERYTRREIVPSIKFSEQISHARTGDQDLSSRTRPIMYVYGHCERYEINSVGVGLSRQTTMIILYCPTGEVSHHDYRCNLPPLLSSSRFTDTVFLLFVSHFASHFPLPLGVRVASSTSPPDTHRFSMLTSFVFIRLFSPNFLQWIGSMNITMVPTTFVEPVSTPANLLPRFETSASTPSSPPCISHDVRSRCARRARRAGTGSN